MYSSEPNVEIQFQDPYTPHDIGVGNSIPIEQHPYRVKPAERVIKRSEVDYLFKNGQAVLSQSPWISPCLRVPKSDASLHFCLDYRKTVNSKQFDKT